VCVYLFRNILRCKSKDAVAAAAEVVDIDLCVDAAETPGEAVVREAAAATDV
jgi:hypothetical protein